MKSGIVVETHDKYSIVFTSDGEFIKTKNIGTLGEEIYFSEYKPRFQIHVLKSMAAVAMLCLFIFSGLYYQDNKTHAQVSYGENHEFVLDLNKDNEVIRIHATNKDAVAVKKALSNWKGKPIEKVKEEIKKSSQSIDTPKDKPKTTEDFKEEKGLEKKNNETKEKVIEKVNQNKPVRSEPKNEIKKEKKFENKSINKAKRNDKPKAQPQEKQSNHKKPTNNKVKENKKQGE